MGKSLTCGGRAAGQTGGRGHKRKTEEDRYDVQTGQGECECRALNIQVQGREGVRGGQRGGAGGQGRARRVSGAGDVRMSLLTHSCDGTRRLPTSRRVRTPRVYLVPPSLASSPRLASFCAALMHQNTTCGGSEVSADRL
ncbi:hypothetical protein E2C01_074551 [Portunus trituberculatus]|uniref:Uncharacterized protein n=1 Tax=Portunus trituberculatus TaxID=210409 RepID=A0A5B7I3L4_PORTR|nr:hypothetical protein [Portunus trituberculatus]